MTSVVVVVVVPSAGVCLFGSTIFDCPTFKVNPTLVFIS